MRAATLCRPQQFELVDVTPAPPGPGQLRVRLEGCGVCASSLPTFAGRPWFRYPLAPGAPGHEGWGVVEAVGDGAEGFVPGERVALLSYHAFAELDYAEAGAVVRLPPALAGRPFPAEPLGCAMNVFSRSDVQPGHTLALVGAGFLGVLLIQLAVKAGARVIAISRRPYALEVARLAGAAETVLFDDTEHAAARVLALTGGQGCERVIEAVGEQAALDLASRLARERGRLVIAGYHQDGPRQVDMQSWNWRGLDVVNAHERDPAVYRRGMEAAVQAVLRGDLRPEPLLTHRVALDQLGRAFDLMRARPDGFLKAMVTL